MRRVFFVNIRMALFCLLQQRWRNHLCRLSWVARAGGGGHGHGGCCWTVSQRHGHHHGRNHAAEVAACSGCRCDVKCVEVGAEPAFLFPFLFSPVCLYYGCSTSHRAVFQPENQKYISSIHSLTVHRCRRVF